MGQLGRRLRWMRQGQRRNRGLHWGLVILSGQHDGSVAGIEGFAS